MTSELVHLGFVFLVVAALRLGHKRNGSGKAHP